jgi:ABC-type spermidine/putrescine transport system permease subunit I
VAGPQLASPTGRRAWPAGLGTGTGAGWLLALPVAFLAGGLIAPLVSVATTAVADKGWGVYGHVLASDLFLHAALRTLTLAAVVTVCCWVLGLAYALGLAVTRGTLRALLAGALLAVFWTSLVVRSYGWILIYQPSGPLSRLLVGLGLRDRPLDLLQTATAMYPAMVHVMLPLMVLPLYGALRALDPARLQAARSLGAGPFLLLRAVVIPELRAASVAGATLVFISSLGFYVTPALLGGRTEITIAMLVSTYFSDALNWGFGSALAVLLLAVTMLGLGIYFALEQGRTRPATP